MLRLVRGTQLWTSGYFGMPMMGNGLLNKRADKKQQRKRPRASGAGPHGGGGGAAGKGSGSGVITASPMHSMPALDAAMRYLAQGSLLKVDVDYVLKLPNSILQVRVAADTARERCWCDARRVVLR